MEISQVLAERPLASAIQVERTKANQTKKEDNVIELNNKDESVNRQSEAEKEEKLLPEELKKQVDNMNKFLDVSFTNLNFKFHEETERYIVQIVEKGTEKIIREIPPEKFLDMISKMMDYLGLMIDKRV